MNMRAVIVGAVESTAVALRAIARSDWNVALCVTLPPSHATRHSDYFDLAPEAERTGAQLFHTTQINDPATLTAIRDVEPNIILVVGWSQICGPALLDIAPGRIIGYHPAALPRLRGRAAIAWTILLDEKITAGSLFWMAGGVDDGPLLDQQYFHVAPRETAASLYTKHMSALDAMLDRSLDLLANQHRPATVQDERCATYAVRRTPADGRVNWAQPATQIDRLVRAAGRPYPGAFTTAQGEQLTIWSAEPVEPALAFHAQPGQLLAADDSHLLVQTGSGQIRVTEWTWARDGPPALHSLLGDAA